MDYNNILNSLGPCGLNCSKCFAFKGGDISKFSAQLRNALGNFDVYAERFVELLDEPEFKNYPTFKLMLNHFSNAQCNGCRKDRCKLFLNCKVKDCSKEHNVDFCYQCDEFPCTKHGFDDHLKKRWISIQNNMKENGIEAYYNEIKDKPRY